MATVTKTIGATGDYATVAAWHADFSNGAVYTAGDTAVGELIDAEITCAEVLPSSALPTTVRLQPAASMRHSGIPGTGARLYLNVSGPCLQVANHNYAVELIGLEISGKGFYYPLNAGVLHAGNSGNGGSFKADSCLIYDFGYGGGSNQYGIRTEGYGFGSQPIIDNCFIYGIKRNSSFGGCVGISDTAGAAINNCTVMQCVNFAAGTGIGYSGGTATNCLALHNDTDFSSVTDTYCASSDSTAVGTGSITSVDALAALQAGCGWYPIPKSGGPLDGAGVAVSGLTTDAAELSYASPPSIGCREVVSASSGGLIDPLGGGLVI